MDDHAESLMYEEFDGGLASAIRRFLPEKLSPSDLAEIQQARQSMVAAKSEKDAAALFPDASSRPCYQVYEHTCGPSHSWPAGVYYHFLGKSSAKEPPALRDVRICGVLKAVAIARNRQGGDFGILLEFRDRLGQLKQWNMPCRLLAGRGDELQKALFDQGLDIHYAQRSRLAEYLCQQHPDRTVWITSTPGWFDHVYVLPDRTIGGDSTDAVLLQCEGNINSGLYRQAGTLSAWQQQVAGLCPGNPFLLFLVSLAFCGPLLAKCHLDSLSIHIYGPSSQGKTSGMQVAASVWGEPKRFQRSWTATLNGLESAAVQVNDGFLCLDEMSKADAQDVSKSLYLLANGVGKQRATVSGRAMLHQHWRVSILSNGEDSIEAQLSKAGIPVKAGELVRFLQLPVFGQCGAFDHLHNYGSGRAFATVLHKHTSQQYGTAGIAFLEHLTRDSRDFATYLDQCLRIFEQRHGPLSAQEARAARGFALIGLAGELASEYGVTGWPERIAMEAALICFKHWRQQRGTGELEPQQLANALRQYVELYGDSRFTKTDDPNRLHGERSGYWRQTERGRQWLFSTAGFKKAIGHADLALAVKLLIGQGILKSGPNPKKHVTQVKVHGGSAWFYVIQFDDDHVG
ncbi:DUF927 domain-containing protein [Methylomonas sp. ZR1]|uniref:DUF927 domain-containing protein n=1 Tax=Methylomonas sp. ZR1 TaxID=1797072 RepID=UPI001491B323|nr:DUF927 domain-containing protein [Methylomonas sp. ZR1]